MYRFRKEKNGMKRIIALNSNTYHGFSLEETFNGMEEAGFTYVELTATKGWTEHVFTDMSFRALWDVKEEMRRRRITPFALSGHTNLMDKDRIEDFIMNMRLANFFGASYILSSIGEAHLEDKKEVSDDEVAEQVRELIPYLREYDLILCLENHGKHGTGRQLREIVEKVGSERVRINYDTANAIFYGNVDLEEDLMSCIDYIGFMHLKDKAGKYNEWNFPAIGEGELDLLMVLRKLDEKGNHCPLSIEIEFTDKGPKDLEEVHEAVRTSFCYLTENGQEIL